MTEDNEAVAVYVLQVNEPAADDAKVWVDVATVTVPKRTNRSTAIKRAVKKTGIEITAEPPVRVRLLDADTAEPIELLGPAPAPGPRQLRI